MAIGSQLRLLSLQLTAAERNAEALTAAQAAVDVLRGFVPAPATEAAYWWLFAILLHDLTIRLIAVGRIDEAVGPAIEAVEVYRRAASVKGADAIAVSNQLRALSSQLASAGLNAEAAIAAQAAVDVLPLRGAVTFSG
jgi:hypothetical protein